MARNGVIAGRGLYRPQLRMDGWRYKLPKPHLTIKESVVMDTADVTGRKLLSPGGAQEPDSYAVGSVPVAWPPPSL